MARHACVIMLFLLVPLGAFLFGCTPRHIGPEVTESGVRFSLRAPEAEKVAVVGSFNDWDRDRHMLSGPSENGVWSITIPLKGGRYEYLFLVDGEEWLPDPGALLVDDGLGGKNSVIFVWE